MKKRKLSGLGWLWVTQGHRQCHHSIQRIFLFNFNKKTMCLTCTAYELFFESCQFYPPHLPLVPPIGGDLVGISKRSLCQKTRVPRFLGCCLHNPMFSHYITIPPCDRRTDQHRAIDYILCDQSSACATKMADSDDVQG